jgi:hypothetical protein
LKKEEEERQKELARQREIEAAKAAEAKRLEEERIRVEKENEAKRLKARLEAEEKDAKEMTFPQDLISDSKHPQALKHMLAQKNLFHARRESLSSQLKVLYETIKTN